MKVLITSGGTTEPIDDVRGISNFATGKLGKLTAEQFLAAGHDVFLLAGSHALLPQSAPHLTIIKITDTQSLFDHLKTLIPQMNVVIHSMAVSDYRPRYMTDLSNFSETLTRADLLNFQAQNAKKISSKADFQLILLEKTPKVIQFIKVWNPNVILFGFKLLAGVSEKNLLETAKESLRKNNADFILANDLENITENLHQAYLVSKNNSISLENKQEIAEYLLKQAERSFHD